MQKVYSIVFKSVLNPGKLALYTVQSDSAEDAYKKGLAQVNRMAGDLMWQPQISSVLTVNDISSGVITDSTQVKEPEINIDLNWLLKTIIDNNDKDLYFAAKQYMEDYHIKFVEDKLTVV